MNIEVTIIDADPPSRKQLEEALKREKLDGCRVEAVAAEARKGPVLWIAESGSTPPNSLKINENDTFPKPVRLGEILDRVRRHLSGTGQQGGQKLLIGPFELDVANNELLDGD